MTKAKERVERALHALRAGGLVLICDHEDRENEGDVVGAAELATTAMINFCITHARGLLCQAITAERAAELELPPMVAGNTSLHGTAFTVSVDARICPSTGVSAVERAITTRVLVDPQTKAEDLLRPGHCFPLIADRGGLRQRQGHTEAVIELMQRAALRPSGILCEVVDADGQMARNEALQAFARYHQLPFLTIDDLLMSE